MNPFRIKRMYQPLVPMPKPITTPAVKPLSATNFLKLKKLLNK